MNHWQMITLAYGLTFAALTLEVVLLFRRRRHALHRAIEGLEALDGPAGSTLGPGDGSAARSRAGSTTADAAGHADGPGAAGARTNAGGAP